MLRSLQLQIILVLVALLSVFVVQVFMSHVSHDALVDFQEQTRVSSQESIDVLSLERDVLDLQRNVLIYKETGSRTAVARFHDLMKKVKEKVALMMRVYQNEARDSDLNVLTRMRGHLLDYNDHFSSVIRGRERQIILYEEGIDKRFSKLLDGVDGLDIEAEKTERIKSFIYNAELNVLKYMQSADYDYIEAYQNSMKGMEDIAQSIGLSSDKHFLSEVKTLKNEFTRLTQIRRGYVSLVNVVMAGAANEFLYLTKQLSLNMKEKQKKISLEAQDIAAKTQFRSDVVAIFCAVSILLIIFFISLRLIFPIRKLTYVFNRLSLGEEVDNIPAIDRADEIGHLAKSASAFRDVNRHTSELLEQTQKLNAEQERLNQSLQEEKSKAENAAKSKSVFLANMSHEIRTPMNGIIGLVSQVMKTSLTEKQREYLNKVSYSSQIMMGVINDILDFSKIEAGKMDIESTQFDLDSVVNNLISAVSVRAREKNLNFRIHIDSSVPMHLYGDPLRINQVLLNLCNNAVKFTDEGHIEVEVQFEPTQEQQGMLHVKVVDTGIGMSEEHQQKIFNSFTQADDSTSRKYGGSGLGLSIVKQLTELMSGTVLVSSELGKGSCFDVSFLISVVDGVEDYLPYKSPKLYHATSDGKVLIHENVIRRCTDKVEYVSFERMVDVISRGSDASSIFLVDVKDKTHLEVISSSLRSMVDQGIHVGCVTDMQPTNLDKLISDQLTLPILSHPFSAGDLERFLQEVAGDKSAGEADVGVEELEDVPQLQGHILLVEDNHINQLVCGGILEDFGVTYDVAEDGQQAVTKVNNSDNYDLVFMDVQMPVMDGYSATKTLREQGFKKLTICGLSANAMKDDLEKAKAAGMDDYITKPIVFEDVERVLCQYLKRKANI